MSVEHLLCLRKGKKFKETSVFEDNFFKTVYKISKKNGLLVAAKDKCLWIEEAVYAETGESIMDKIKRYDRFCRIQDLFTELYSKNNI